MGCSRLQVSSLLNLVESTTVPILKSGIISKGIEINYLPDGTGGLEGFRDIPFFMDQMGLIANTFFVISPKSNLLQIDAGARPIHLNSKLVRLVYPMYYN